MSRRSLGALLALAIAVAAPGCGGGDDEENDPIAKYCDKIAQLQAEPDPTAGLKKGLRSDPPGSRSPRRP